MTLTDCEKCSGQVRAVAIFHLSA